MFCQYSKEIWDGVKDSFVAWLNRRFFTSIWQWLFQWISDANDKHARIFYVSAWHIWISDVSMLSIGDQSFFYMILQHTFKTKVRFGLMLLCRQICNGWVRVSSFGIIVADFLLDVVVPLKLSLYLR
jgi:hypothetical protein